MNTGSNTQHYHPAIKTFHWLVAVLVFAVWPLGFLLGMVKSGFHNDFFFWHASLGFTILWLMLARLCVRFLSDTPAKPSSMPGWLESAAHLNQWLLYLALITQPVIGFLLASAGSGQFVWFGVIPIPSPLGKAPTIAPTLAELHEFFAWVILVLVGLHICGALYHRVICRDDTLARMT
ncbi:cytochrome b [Salinisphaera hydrothermalis]|uniref:cytochrome b n=1 Tax=Salinisphaera hydrothermalis TaxID=563188 RepID=UPI003341C446